MITADIIKAETHIFIPEKIWLVKSKVERLEIKLAIKMIIIIEGEIIPKVAITPPKIPFLL